MGEKGLILCGGRTKLWAAGVGEVGVGAWLEVGRRQTKWKEPGENVECQVLRINPEGSGETVKVFKQENHVVRFGF